MNWLKSTSHEQSHLHEHVPVTSNVSGTVVVVVVVGTVVVVLVVVVVVVVGGRVIVVVVGGSVVVVVVEVVVVVVLVVVDVVVVEVVVVVDVVVVVVGSGIWRSPKRTSCNSCGIMSILDGFGVVTSHPAGTCSVTMYCPTGMQLDMNNPLSAVTACMFKGPLTSNTKPGSGSSPSSHMPLALGSSNLNIFM